MKRKENSGAIEKSYSTIVRLWADERSLMGNVQPYTAKKSAEKARLFLPWFGDTPVDKIDTESITNALISLSQTGGRRSKGLSSSTLRAAYLAGTQAVDWAIGRGLATANPFRLIPRPKANHPRSRFLVEEEAAALATEMKRHMRTMLLEMKVQQASFALAVCIALATGMRRGEIFAMEWRDVDVRNERLNISRAIKGDGSLGEPKSRSSIRSIGVGERLIALMEDMRSWQRANLTHETLPNQDFVLCNKYGNHANMSTFGHWWRSWADCNGWAGLHFHDLRHSHATILISNGVDVKTAQARLGHSSAETTLSIYAHAIPFADSAAASSIDERLFT